MEDEAGKIEVSWLDGSHREVFLGEDIIWPNGLSIDYIGQRIYWCDSYLQRIESMSLSRVSEHKNRVISFQPLDSNLILLYHLSQKSQIFREVIHFRGAGTYVDMWTCPHHILGKIFENILFLNIKP